MKEENLDKIFEPFTRVSSDPTYSGTGIGLATCQKIMEKYDSDLKVQSTLGRGSIFSFVLPIATVANQYSYTDNELLLRSLPKTMW